MNGGLTMDLQGRLLSALLITYFVSRLTLRLPNPLRRAWGISLAHLISLGAITAALLAWRGTAQGSAAEQVLVYVSPQVLWWVLDLLREHDVKLAFMKARSGHQAP